MANGLCRYCGIILTEENARKRKEVTSGFRPECKPCRNKYERRNTRKKQCEYCSRWGIFKGKRSFCSIECRFRTYYTVNIETGCWEWRKKWRRKGDYGIFVIGKKRMISSRVSYELFKGPIAADMFVCHACDNPPCVNPDHLWLGTNQENQQDRFNKKYKV